MWKQKRYVVWDGKKTGIFPSWEECEAAVKWFSGAKYKSFESVALAQQALAEWSEQYYKKSPSVPLQQRGKPDGERKKYQGWFESAFEKKSIAVDAACSGNPWVMEYQGIDLQSWKQIFHQKFDNGTNNIWEFLALVHALGYLEAYALDDIFVYTDSKIAMHWVAQKKCKTQADVSEELQAVISRAEMWLKHNYSSKHEKKILKRKTSEWWEIPADFGRK